MSQFARPVSPDVSTGNWTTAPLYAKVDEVSYDDLDYIQLNNSTSSSCELTLSSVTDPEVATGHIVRIRSKKTGTGTITLTGYLVEGTTVRATITISLTTGFLTTEYTLTAGEANAITNYANLRIRLTGVAASSSRYVQTSWAEFEVPNTPATQLVIQDASHAHASDSAALTQHNILAAQDASHAHLADAIALVQHNILAIQEASHGHEADNVTLTAHAASTQLEIQDASHDHTAESPALVQHNVLAIQDASNAHTAESPALTQHNILAIQDASNAHTAESPALVQHNILSVADGSHGHTAESPALIQHNVLSIADATHGHTADNVTLTAHAPGGTELTIADATHGHTAESPALVQHNVLSIADASHAHTVENVTLTLGLAGKIDCCDEPSPHAVDGHNGVLYAIKIEERMHIKIIGGDEVHG